MAASLRSGKHVSQYLREASSSTTPHSRQAAGRPNPGCILAFGICRFVAPRPGQEFGSLRRIGNPPYKSLTRFQTEENLGGSLLPAHRFYSILAYSA